MDHHLQEMDKYFLDNQLCQTIHRQCQHPSNAPATNSKFNALGTSMQPPERSQF